MRYIHTTEHHKATKTENQSQNNNTEESYKHYVEQKKLGTKTTCLLTSLSYKAGQTSAD